MSRVKTIGLSFVRLLGFKRSKPRTRLGKLARRSERALSIASLLYLALLCFPQILFAHNVSEKGVTIYSRSPLPAETAARIDEAMKLVGDSELAVPGRSERVFICDQPWLYRLFHPIHRDEFAVSFPVTDNIFIAEADLARNLARSPAPVHNQRTVSSVVAHEITHGLIRHRLGLIRGIWLPSWVSEGYCDYVARESSFPEEEGVQRLREGNKETTASFRYFVYRQMVRHLVQDRHYSFDEIARHAGEGEAIKAETIAAMREARP